MKDSNAEIRKAVMGLLSLTKKFRVRADTCDSTLKIVLEAILKLPPEQRPSFDPGGIDAVMKAARRIAEERVCQSTRRLENALESGKDWLTELQAYAP